MSRCTETPKHTPGPWKLMDKYRLIQVSDSDEHDNEHAVVHWTGFDSGDKPWDEKRANARLIAAAPDLLAACEAAEKVIIEGAHVMLHAQLRAAIAKAKK